MKKKIIFLSAVLMSFSLITGCNSAAAKNSEQESTTEVTETTTEEPTEPATEATTRYLTDVDPFEGLEFTYHHTQDGTVEECQYNAFAPVIGALIDNEAMDIQKMQIRNDGLSYIRKTGCNMSIYRAPLDDNLKEGDKITFHLKLDSYDVKEKDIPGYVAQAFGINLTRTVLEYPVHFEESPIEDIDPFGDKRIYFSKNGAYINVNNSFDDCDGCRKARSRNVIISYRLSPVDGADLSRLYVGDKIKYTVVMKENGKEYVGDEVNTQLDKGWKRVHINPTEKVLEVLPDNQNYRYANNVNVSLNRSDDWYQAVSNTNRFNKYDFFHIDGSTATIPITCELFRQFCGLNDDVLGYYIDHNTTGPAYEKLIRKQDEKTLILVTEPSDDELNMAAENNVDLNVDKIALDGFVFITHKDNPVDSLTVEQIQDIYSGYITNWSEVGGYDEEIIAYQREANSGSQTVMENMVMDGIEMVAAPTERIPMTMGGLIDHIAAYKNSTQSIGYTFNYYLNNLYKNENIKVIRINDIAPDNENLLDGSYPFSSGYYAVTLNGGDAKAEEIKDFLLSDEGQELVRLAGYCPIR